MSQPYRYLRYDLESSIEVARAIHDRGGGQVSSDQLAEFLNYKSKNNGAFLSRVAAARLFGLVDGTTNSLRPTPRAISILAPDFPERAARARLEAFESIPLFKEFLRSYEGQPLPNQEGMKNKLKTDFGIKDETAASIALARLMDSAEQAGLFTVAGNRAKMIRPSFGGARFGETPAPLERPTEPLPLNGRGQSDETRPVRTFPTLIEGALEQLPTEGEWGESQLRQWLQLMELALRMVYKIPKES